MLRARKLVSANVQRAENHLCLGTLQDRLVCKKLLLFAGQTVASQEEKLGTVQAHAIGPAHRRGLRFLRKLDICRDADLDPIERFGGLPNARQERLAKELMRAPPLKGFALFLYTRSNDDLATQRVDENFMAVRRGAGNSVHTHKRWDTERRSQDSGVGRRAAAFRDDAHHVLLALVCHQLHREPRRELVGDNDAATGWLRRAFAAKLSDDVTPNLLDVRDAFAEVRARRRRQRRFERLDRRVNRPLRADALFVDQRQGRVHKHRVTVHEEVRVEHERRLRARLAKRFGGGLELPP